MEKYLGLIELGVTIVGMTAFVIWQFRVLKRDKAATKAREAEQQHADEDQV